MGNNLVGEIIDKMKSYDSSLTVVKIWNKAKLSIILACNDPSNWRMEQDPYFAYNGKKIDGLTFTDNIKAIKEVCTDSNLIYNKANE